MDKLRSVIEFFRRHLQPGSRLHRLGGGLRGYFVKLSQPGITWKRRLLILLAGLAAAGAVMVTLVLLYAVVLIPFTPSISDIRKARIDNPSVVMSSDGRQLAEFVRQNREWVPLSQVSPWVPKALIDTEDQRFYQHHGVDFKRLASAAVHTLIGHRQGGSTLTQQLARNLYPDEIGSAPTLTRKLKEAITAFKIESVYSKKDILETYLNTVPFLYNAVGIQMAAQTYFNKDAKDLNVLESATLVGMLKGNAYYNPVLNPSRALTRRNTVLEQLVKHHDLSQAEFDRLKTRPIRLDFAELEPDASKAPHFTEFVRRWLIDWADRHGYNIYSDGLVVHTTIDSRLQQLAQQAVTREANALQKVVDVEWGQPSARALSTNISAYNYYHQRVRPFSYLWRSHPELLKQFIRESPQYKAALKSGLNDKQAIAQLLADKEFMHNLEAAKTHLATGFVAIDPSTGAIKAWVGSRDYQKEPFDHVDRARRQPGSTFKAFLYAAALEKGYTPNDTLPDKPVSIRMPNGSVWQPTDMEGASGRNMTLRDALAYSKNTIAAELGQKVGISSVIRTARAMGVNKSDLDDVPSLVLGTSPVTLLEMVSAYSTIADKGLYREPVFVTRIEDKKGNVLATFEPSDKPKEAIPEKTANTLLDMMRDVINRGTGHEIRSRFGIRADVAGKTGTSQNNTDGWFIMMHPQLVTGAWVGFDDARITFRSSYWGQGGHNALLEVGDFYHAAINRGLINGRLALPQPPKSWLQRMLDPVINGADQLFNNVINGIRGFGQDNSAVPAPTPQSVAPQAPAQVAPAPAPVQPAPEYLPPRGGEARPQYAPPPEQLPPDRPDLPPAPVVPDEPAPRDDVPPPQSPQLAPVVPLQPDQPDQPPPPGPPGPPDAPRGGRPDLNATINHSIDRLQNDVQQAFNGEIQRGQDAIARSVQQQWEQARSALADPGRRYRRRGDAPDNGQ